MKRILSCLLTLALIFAIPLPGAAAQSPKIGWIFDRMQTANWWYYGKNNRDEVVSHVMEDLVRSEFMPVTLSVGEGNQFGGAAAVFDWSFDPAHTADVFANVGQVVTVDLKTYTHLFFSIGEMPAGGTVEVKLAETFAGETVLSCREAGEYYVDLREVYPGAGKQTFWVNFCLVLPGRVEERFVFDYIMIGNEHACSYNINAIERTMEPWALDIEAQKDAWIYYGKNDEGTVLRTNLRDTHKIPIEFYGEDSDYPGEALSATFLWPEQSQADYFQRIGIRITADLDDTPYLYAGLDFGRGDWVSIGTASEFDRDDGFSERDDVKQFTGERVINLRSVYGSGVHTFLLVLVFADMNYDSSEFWIDYLYMGSSTETPESLWQRKSRAIPERRRSRKHRTSPQRPMSRRLRHRRTILRRSRKHSRISGAEMRKRIAFLSAVAVCMGVLCLMLLAMGLWLLKKGRRNAAIGVLLVALLVGVLAGLFAFFAQMSDAAPPVDDEQGKQEEEKGEEPYPYEDLILTPTEDADSVLHVRVLPAQLDPVREDSDGMQRMLYLQIENPKGLTVDDAILTYQSNGKQVRRSVCPIAADDQTVVDTFYLDAAFVGLLEACITDAAGNTLWSGTLAVKPARNHFTVSYSHVYDLNEVKSGALRGANYFNREFCWGKDWQREDAVEIWDADFADFTAKLHINTVRAFPIMLDAQMYHAGNTPTAAILSKLHDFLTVADRYGVKIIFCLNSGFHPGFRDKTGENMRFLRTIVELFQNDGRVIAWDLANEIDCAQALEDEIAAGEMGTYSRYVTEMYPLLRDEWAPRHITMIGTGFKLYNLQALGVTTECGSYHGYVQTDLPSAHIAKGYAEAAASYFNGKEGAWILEEFGFPSEDARGVEDMQYQADVYRGYIGAIRSLLQDGYRLLGVCQWCIYDYVDRAGVIVQERRNGVICEDGTLKEAGHLLAEFYAELAQTTPAPWDGAK